MQIENSGETDYVWNNVNFNLLQPGATSPLAVVRAYLFDTAVPWLAALNIFPKTPDSRSPHTKFSGSYGS